MEGQDGFTIYVPEGEQAPLKHETGMLGDIPYEIGVIERRTTFIDDRPHKKGSRAMPMRVRTGDLVRYQGTEGEGEGYIVGFLLDCPDVAIVSDGPGRAAPVNLHRITFNSGSFLAHAYALRCEHERRVTEWPLQPLIKEALCEPQSRS